MNDYNQNQYFGGNGATPPPYGNQNPYGNPAPQKPDNYLVWAILVTIFCCLPLGIVAIVYAAKVDSLWYGGRQQEAIEASNSAKKWTIAGAVSSIAIMVIYILLLMAGAFSLAALEGV